MLSLKTDFLFFFATCQFSLFILANLSADNEAIRALFFRTIKDRMLVPVFFYLGPILNQASIAFRVYLSGVFIGLLMHE